MNAVRWTEVDRVFAAVLERPTVERPQALDAACAGDRELQQEVEQLLAADQRVGEFLELPAGELLGLVPPGGDGGRAGPYRLLRRIGSGGMGTVYLARRDDDQYDRLVAVKVLRWGLDTPEARIKFLAERQILAHLEHPNIARLYDGGTTAEGRPYLVMELVEGLPVDQYCAEHRLTVEQRLQLFRRICAAVQYAHQNLLVHRDLKPGNILVTAEGEPKLLDFGIAKRLEPGEGAGGDGGDRIMTPLYASPEQMQGGAITTASDVYSLGVVLYELLAGRLPDGQESGLDRLRGDLDSILLRALHEDPQGRYASAALLSQDLGNHLAHRPVAARPRKPLYVAGRLVRRNRTAAVATTLLVLLGAGFLVSFIVDQKRLTQERDKARQARSFLVDTFKKADPYASGGRLTQEEVLDEGAGRAARELTSQPDLQAEVMDSIGEIALRLGHYDRAQPLLERALELRRRTFGAESLPVAASLEHLGLLKWQRSQLPAAEALLRQALALERRRLGERDLAVAKVLNELGDVVADEVRYADAEKLHWEALSIAHEREGQVGPVVAASILGLGRRKRNFSDLAAAERLYLQGLDIERRALGNEAPQLYRDRETLAEILTDAGKYQEAETLLRQSLAAQQRILGREHPDVVLTLNALGLAEQRLARFGEAEVFYREALPIARRQFGPTNRQVADILNNLGSVLVGLDQPAPIRKGIPFYEEALAIRRQNLGELNPGVAEMYLALAEAHRMLHESDKALPLALRSLAILERIEKPDHLYVAYALREVGREYVDLNRQAEAEPYLRRALDIRRRTLPAGNPDVAKAKISLGECLARLGRDAEAEVLLREADAAFSAQFPANDYRRLELRSLRERLKRERGRPQYMLP